MPRLSVPPQPHLPKVYSARPRDCIPACVATLTGLDLDRARELYVNANDPALNTVEAMIRSWLDAFNSEFAKKLWANVALRGPLPSPIVGLNIAVIQGPADPTGPSHAVIVLARIGEPPFVIHDPGLVPYEYAPEVLYYIALTDDCFDCGTGFTDFVHQNHAPEELYDEPFHLQRPPVD